MTTIKNRLRDIERRKADLVRIRSAIDTEEIRLEGEHLMAKMDDHMTRLRAAWTRSEGQAP